MKQSTTMNLTNRTSKHPVNLLVWSKTIDSEEKGSHRKLDRNNSLLHNSSESSEVRTKRLSKFMNSKQMLGSILNCKTKRKSLSNSKIMLNSHSRKKEKLEESKVENLQRLDKQQDFNNDELLLSKLIPILEKKKIGKLDISNYELNLLMTYLDSIPNFINTAKDRNEEYYSDLLRNISLSLKYEFAEKDKILFKYGQKGEKFYILIKGECSVLVPKKERVQLTENEYLEYLLTLRAEEEFEILNMTLSENFKIYQVNLDEFDFWLEDVFNRNVTVIEGYDENYMSEIKKMFLSTFKKKKLGSKINSIFKSSVNTVDLLIKKSIGVKNINHSCKEDAAVKYNNSSFNFNQNQEEDAVGKRVEISTFNYPDNCRDIMPKIAETLKRMDIQRMIIEPDDQYMDKDDYLKTLSRFSNKVKNKVKKEHVNFFIEYMGQLHPNLELKQKSRRRINEGILKKGTKDLEDGTEANKKSNIQFFEEKKPGMISKRSSGVNLNEQPVPFPNEMINSVANKSAKRIKESHTKIINILHDEDSDNENKTIKVKDVLAEAASAMTADQPKSTTNTLRNIYSKQSFKSPTKKPKLSILNVRSLSRLKSAIPDSPHEEKQSIIPRTEKRSKKIIFDTLKLDAGTGNEKPVSTFISPIKIVNQEAKNNERPNMLKTQLKNIFKTRMFNSNQDVIDSSRRLFTIYYYEEMGVLGKGTFFGDRALESYNSKRTATILINDDTHLAVIEKSDYKLFLQDISNKLKLRTMNMILSNCLFNNINQVKFDRLFYNNFIQHRYYMGEKVILQNEANKGIYFTREGALQVTFTGTLKDLNKVIECLSGYTMKMENYKDMVIDCDEEELILLDQIHKLKVAIFSENNLKKEESTRDLRSIMQAKLRSSEVIGIDDFCFVHKKSYLKRTSAFTEEFFRDIAFIDGSTSLFSVEVISPRAILFHIPIINFLEMLQRDKRIHENYVNMRVDRRNVMLERMLNLKKQLKLSMKKKLEQNNKESHRLFKSKILALNNKTKEIQDLIKKPSASSISQVNKLALKSGIHIMHDDSLKDTLNLKNNSSVQFELSKGTHITDSYKALLIDDLNPSRTIKQAQNSRLTFSMMNSNTIEMDVNYKIAKMKSNKSINRLLDLNIIESTYYNDTLNSFRKSSLEKISKDELTKTNREICERFQAGQSHRKFNSSLAQSGQLLNNKKSVQCLNKGLYNKLLKEYCSKKDIFEAPAENVEAKNESNINQHKYHISSITGISKGGFSSSSSNFTSMQSSNKVGSIPAVKSTIDFLAYDKFNTYYNRAFSTFFKTLQPPSTKSKSKKGKATNRENQLQSIKNDFSLRSFYPSGQSGGMRVAMKKVFNSVKSKCQNQQINLGLEIQKVPLQIIPGIYLNKRNKDETEVYLTNANTTKISTTNAGTFYRNMLITDSFI